jgi:hypothetical protein
MPNLIKTTLQQTHFKILSKEKYPSSFCRNLSEEEEKKFDKTLTPG